MLVLVALYLLFSWFHALASTLAWALGVSELYIWAAYFAASYACESRLHTHRPDWRGGWLAAFVGRVLQRTAFANPGRLETLDRRQYIFACYPHGIAPLHLIFGFAAHGGQPGLPPELAARTLVVAHWIFKGVPLLRNLYAAFGVIGSDRASVKWALDAGYSLAIAPGGLAAKSDSLLERRDDDRVYVHTSRNRLGIYEYANRYGCPIVPIFSPHEDDTYLRLFTRLRCAPLVLVLGRWLVFQRRDELRWTVGRPVSPRETREATARAVCRELEENAAPHRIVWVCEE